MAKRGRGSNDLSIHDALYRSFEWYWSPDGTMAGLDAYEQMSVREQDDFIASIEHWGNVPEGGRAARSRVNQEHEDPLIVAIKAGKQRFTAFREESGPTWIVCDNYLKEGRKRDKTGDRAVARTIEKRTSYFDAVKKGKYYERG